MIELNCVDMSRWGGDLTADEAAAMKAEGIGTVIVASGPGGYGLMARQQGDRIPSHEIDRDGAERRCGPGIGKESPNGFRYEEIAQTRDQYDPHRP